MPVLRTDGRPACLPVHPASGTGTRLQAGACHPQPTDERLSRPPCLAAVGILVDRSPAVVIGMFGVLKVRQKWTAAWGLCMPASHACQRLLLAVCCTACTCAHPLHSCQQPAYPAAAVSCSCCPVPVQRPPRPPNPHLTHPTHPAPTRSLAALTCPWTPRTSPTACLATWQTPPRRCSSPSQLWPPRHATWRRLPPRRRAAPLPPSF